MDCKDRLVRYAVWNKFSINMTILSISEQVRYISEQVGVEGDYSFSIDTLEDMIMLYQKFEM